LNELPVVRLRRGRNARHDELFEVGYQTAVLSVAVKGDGRAAVDLDGLSVIDCEDLMADLILAI